MMVPPLPMAKTSVHPGHAAPGTAHLDEIKSKTLEPEQLG